MPPARGVVPGRELHGAASSWWSRAEPVLYDPLDDHCLGPDLIVLAAGCDGPAAEALVRAAGADGAAAVVLKARPGGRHPVGAAEAVAGGAFANAEVDRARLAGPAAPVCAFWEGHLDALGSEIERGRRRRRDAATLLGLMRRATGQEPRMWGSIVGFGAYHYRYASGREGDAPAAGFAARKAATSVYLADGAGAHAEALERLGPHSTGVGCLYLKDLHEGAAPTSPACATPTLSRRGRLGGHGTRGPCAGRKASRGAA